MQLMHKFVNLTADLMFLSLQLCVLLNRMHNYIRKIYHRINMEQRALHHQKSADFDQIRKSLLRWSQTRPTCSKLDFTTRSKFLHVK